MKKTQLIEKPSKYSDYLLYLLVAPFLLPLLYCISQGSMQYIGGWYVVDTILFIVFISIFYKKILLKSDEIKFSKFGIITFFSAVLISFSYTTVSKYLTFYTPSRDPGIFFSMVQAMLAGNFGYSSVAGIYHFGTHQNYILVLLAPFYAIFPSPIFLQIVGGMTTLLAGIVLWKIVRLYFNQFIAAICVVAFYASPSNHFYGFRPELFYPLTLFTLYYVCATRQKLLLIILATLFLLSVKEDAPLYTPGFIYILFRNKDHKGAITVALLAILTVLVNILIVQPYFVHKSNQVTAATLEFYSQWGQNNHEILINILTQPLKVVSLFFDSNSGFWYTFGYWLFIPLISPFLLLTGVLPLCLFAISNAPRMHMLSEYYAITPNALAYLGAIVGLYMIGSRFKLLSNNIFKIFILLLLLCHNLFYVRFADLFKLDYSNMSSQQIISIWASAPIYRGRWQEFFPIDSQALDDFDQLNQALLTNYKNARICPSNQVYPHLDYRDFHNLQPFGWDNINQTNCVNVFAALGDIWPLNPDSLREQASQMLQTEKCNRFGNFFYCDNLDK